MTTTAKAGQTARQKARERRIALEAAAKARNDRIDNWTTAVFTGVEERQRALHAQAAAEDAMADALMRLAGEGLSTSEIADISVMTVGEVHKLAKRPRTATHEQPPRVTGRLVASLVSGQPSAESEQSSRAPSSSSRGTGVGAIDG